MNYEEKLEALNALAECSLKMRKPGDWYVSQSVEVKNGGMLEGRYGNGETPELAIHNHWSELTELLKAGEYLVIKAYGDNRKAVKWNGFMWQDVKEDK